MVRHRLILTLIAMLAAAFSGGLLAADDAAARIGASSGGSASAVFAGFFADAQSGKALADDAVLALVMVAAILILFVVLWQWASRKRRRQDEERRRLRDLFQSMPDLVWLKDPDGIYLACNSQFERFFGAKEAEILGKTDYDFVPKDLADFFRAMDREAVSSGVPHSNEEWVTFADDGRRALLETVKTAMRDSRGKLVGVLGVAREITKLREAEISMRELQARFEVAFRSSPVAAALFDANDDTFIDVNGKFANDFGWQPEELIGATPEGIGLWFEPAERGQWRVDLERERAMHGYQVRWRHRKGALRWVSISASLIEVQGKPSVLLHAVDITQRRQTESLLEGQRAILELIANRVPLETILLALVHMIESQAPDVFASVLLADEDGRHLSLGAAPSLPGAFKLAVDGIEIGPTMGSCGAAVYRREPVYVEDIGTDPACEAARELALAHGLRACWSTPISDKSGRMLGTFALYKQVTGLPTELHRRLIALACQMASLAIERQREDSTLRASEAYNKLLFSDSVLPLVVVDPETGYFVDANNAALHAAGRSSLEELRSKHIGDFSPPTQIDGSSSAEGAWGRLQQSKMQREQVFEWRFQRPDGGLWDAEIRMVRFTVNGRDLVQVALQDITARKRGEESLRLAATVFDSTSDGITIANHDGNIIAVNRAFTTITGYEEDEVLGRNPRFLRSGRHDHVFYKEMWETLTHTGLWRGEIWNRHKSGEVFPEWLTISAARGPDGQTTHYVAVFSDISSLRRTQDALDHQAHHDPLTGLPNRKLLLDRLEHALLRAQRLNVQLAVMFIDLDRFKNVNDTLGHSVGDALLMMAAQRMTQHVRSSDTVARLGGDEFVLVLEEDVSYESVCAVAEKLIEVFCQPMLIGSHELDISASIGISMFPDNGADVDALLKQADMAMYQVKGRGRNAYAFYDSYMGADTAERMKVETALRRALKRGELYLHYQPQLRMDNGRIAGVEALARWTHPELGSVPPGSFIPVAEEIGVICEIGEWVLAEACRQFAAWREMGLQIPRISVNLSVQQIESSDLPTIVSGLLQCWNLPPSALELEVTESTLMRQTDRVAQVLEALREMGVFLAVDDFGTGYSSLAYLKRLPVHRLKIDRSFVKDIGQDLNDEAIVRAIVALGHSLGLELVAEGVERHEQEAFLREVGCDFAQGYFYGRPVSALELPRSL